MQKTIWERKYQGRTFDPDVNHWERLLAFTPEFEPAGFRETYRDFQSDEQFDEDATAPFFSETYLYNLLGKEDARTLLALLRRALESSGLDMYEIEQAVYSEEQEKVF